MHVDAFTWLNLRTESPPRVAAGLLSPPTSSTTELHANAKYRLWHLFPRRAVSEPRAQQASCEVAQPVKSFEGENSHFYVPQLCQPRLLFHCLIHINHPLFSSITEEDNSMLPMLETDEAEAGGKSGTMCLLTVKNDSQSCQLSRSRESHAVD